MNDEELISIVDQEIANSVGYYSGRLAEDRKLAMEYYYGEPFGNEVDGRSQFVSQDVADTIEWIMPALMKIFAGSDDLARFDPVGPEDEASAKQVTDYVHYVFTVQNPGFVALYTFFKDALLLKNGFVKVYWEDYQKRRIEEYDNLEEMELTKIVQDIQAQGGQVEIEASKGYKGRIKLVIHSTGGKICVDPVPPDEVLISKNAGWDIQKARCVVHRVRKTASELREMGYVFEDGEFSSDDPDAFGMERQTRFLHEQEDVIDYDNADPSSRQYTVDEAYLLVDYDGDGIAERRQICKVGKTLLRTEEGDANYEIARVPLETVTPIMMPHKLYGRSVAELIMDLQLLKSTLIRQILDNMYLTNNSRVMVLDQMANIDDLLTVRPGGIVRVKTFDAVKPLPVPFFGAPAFNMLSYIDQIREQRSGTRYFQGIDPDALAKDTSGVALANFANAAMERIELIARIFAETGVKGIFWAIYELASKHVRKAQVIRLRNQWVQVDPRGWANRYDLTVAVGLGSGSKEQFLRSSAVLGQMMKDIVEAGLFGRVVTEQNIYNFARYTAEAIAPKKADLFFTDPSQLGPPQPKEDPKIEVQKAKVFEMSEKRKSQDQLQRDMKAVDFLTQVAGLAKEEPSEDKGAEFAHERGMAKMKMSHDRDMQLVQQEHDVNMKFAEQMSTIAQQLTTNLDAMAQAQQQMLASQAQLVQNMQEIAKLAGAERELITDEKGEPVRSRVVMPA